MILYKLYVNYKVPSYITILLNINIILSLVILIPAEYTESGLYKLI